MSRLYRQHVARQERAPEIIAAIERAHAEPDYTTVKHFMNAYGIRWEDACHVEELERELDKLAAKAVRLGLSEEERRRRYNLELEQDRFIRAAQCHAKKQAAKKQRDRKRSKHAA